MAMLVVGVTHAKCGFFFFAAEIYPTPSFFLTMTIFFSFGFIALVCAEVSTQENFPALHTATYLTHT